KITLSLLGLWWDAKVDWKRAHESAQQDEGPEGSWVHAVRKAIRATRPITARRRMAQHRQRFAIYAVIAIFSNECNASAGNRGGNQHDPPPAPIKIFQS